MSDSSAVREPLGVGAIISETFSIFFRRIGPILIVGFVIFFGIGLLNSAFLGLNTAAGLVDPFAIDPTGEFVGPSGGQIAGFLVSILLGLLAYALLIAVFVLLAYDAKLGRPARIVGYFGASIPVIVPTLLLYLVSSILIVLGLVLFILPGLWLAAVFSVMVPAIVIERAGFGALGRSAELTKGYRWSIVGLYLIMILITIVVSLVLVAVVGAVTAGLITGAQVDIAPATALIVLAVNSVTSALSYGFTAVMVAMIYARLREIKEGVGVASLADVFR